MTRAEILNCLTDRPCDSCKFHESGRCERWECVFEEKPDDAEPCEDAISRQAVLDMVEDMTDQFGNKHRVVTEGLISMLPPVTPKPKTEWIPVSERLPEPFSYVNCTCHSLIDDREDWVVETFYLPQPPNSPYSDWGNIPMLNWGECEVIAWMYRDIPEPYMAESEDTE